MAWHFFKTLLFTVLVPGTVAGWLPQWLLVLRARFGEPYEAYRREVRRWIPRPPRKSPEKRHRDG